MPTPIAMNCTSLPSPLTFLHLPSSAHLLTPSFTLSCHSSFTNFHASARNLLKASCSQSRREFSTNGWSRTVTLRSGFGVRLRRLDCRREWKSGGVERKKCVAVRAAEEGDTGVKNMDYKAYQALMRGGEEVIGMMQEMVELLEGTTGMGSEAEEIAVEMAATGAVGQRLEKLDESFLMALDYMIQQAERDDKQRSLLEVIKDTVLAQLAQKFPSQVQIVGILCRTKNKDARQEVLRRCAGGGGTFDQTGGSKLTLPAANLNDIAKQANDIISTMEEKATVEDRRLLARLVLVREEARSLLSGGLQDERNITEGLKSLPEPEVNFLTKIVGLRPGPALHKRLADVLGGIDEGADIAEEKTSQGQSHGTARAKFVRKKPPAQLLPVRPGLFLETVSKVLAGMYITNAAGGVTVQHLEWIHTESLKILQGQAFS